MATPVIMPKQGQSVESCIITKWHKKVNDKVKVGDLLFSYETDKASFEEEAKTEGTILAIFFEEGDDVECLKNVCVIGNEGEDFNEFAPDADIKTEKEDVKTNQNEEVTENTIPKTESYINEDGLVKISPRAKNLAIKSGVNINLASPTGAEGRIIEKDIINLISEGKAATLSAKEQYQNTDIDIKGTGLGGRITTFDLASAKDSSDEPEYIETKLTNIRKIIAKSMQQSLLNSAQLTLNSTFDAKEILSFRKKLKESKDEDISRITINDIILFAVSRALLKHKEINANLIDDKLLLFNTANIGIACDTKRGLMVPTLFKADKLSLLEISKKSKDLINSCKDGSINPDLLTGGTFTVTNLGTLGIESFTPVLNPPQTGILGVCNVIERTKNNKVYPAMGLSLTFDHRALDGAPAARFLQEVTNNLENFSYFISVEGGII